MSESQIDEINWGQAYDLKSVTQNSGVKTRETISGVM